MCRFLAAGGSFLEGFMTLTKSRFVLATECATKLYYKDNPSLYVDRSLEDDFLLALAEGGFQVGALARVGFEGGVLIDRGTLEERLQRTTELLQRNDVTIFEAVIRAGELLVIVDVLRKRGTDVDLMEVKAKSYAAAVDGDLRSKGDRTLSDGFMKYLYDIAFQFYVFRLAWPALSAHPYLVLVNKASRTSVDGLNARFKIRRTADNRSTIEVAAGTDAKSIGDPLLFGLPVHEQVDELLAGRLLVGDEMLPFAQAVDKLKHAHLTNERIWSPPGAHCADCQFRAAPDGERRSGFRECWGQAFKWREADFAEPTVLDLWDFKRKADVMRVGRLKLRDLTDDDVGGGTARHRNGGMSRNARRRLQVSFAREGRSDDSFDALGFAKEMRGWTWPLNFIDFETCMVAVPFTRGRRPYEQIAFQFSHHVKQKDGRVEHASQFIDATPGRFPNYGFVRALHQALTKNGGSIFRWHYHENKVLRAIRDQLEVEPDHAVPDRDVLIEFIDSITQSPSGKGKKVIEGPRNMVDLCEVAMRYYFDPATHGSSSLKKVLPALMRTSTWLRQRYGAPVYGIGCEIPSLNFAEAMTWWQQKDGQVVDPYGLLPPIFADLGLGVADQDRLEWALPEKLRDGGAAMTAYARLQFEGMPADARKRVEDALLKYCELDTLAMVMAVEAWEARLS